MRKVKVLKGHTRKSTPILIEFGRNVVVKMTGNPNFNASDLALATITTGVNLVETKYMQSLDGSRLAKAELRQARKNLEDMLYKLSLSVEKIGLGNRAIIASSGFEATKEPVAIERPIFKAKLADKDGKVILKHKMVKGARVWFWQYCADPITATGWTAAGMSCNASFAISGLKSCTKYWFRAAYFDKSGQSNWSVPYCLTVL